MPQRGSAQVDFQSSCRITAMTRSRLPSIALTAIMLLTPAAVAHAQQKRDSVEARRKAVSAQARFEFVRRVNLPLEYSGGTDCDARVGRFCQYNNADDTVEARKPRVISRARATLIASLDQLQKKSPRDGWITGQRVRYLIEAKNDTAALRVARECQAAAWWCNALEGLALHELREIPAADSAFNRALATMPAAEKCRWTDVTPLLDPAFRSRFKKVGCGKNENIAERLWWLADPFWSQPGNDRRTEHYARHTMAKIQEPARNAYNISWANDLREMVVRYGWARYWTRGHASALSRNDAPVSGHEATPNYHFVPVSLTTDTVPKVKFDIDLDESSERYSSVIAKRVFEIQPQVAVFRRGDSAKVVVAYDVALRRELDSIPVWGSLALAPDENSPIVSSLDSADRKGALSVMVTPRSYVVSLEAIDTVAHRGAAWSRSVLQITPLKPGDVAVSDPLLFDPDDSEIGDLEAAMRRALGSNTIKRGKVGLYWEIYGLSQSDSARPISLTLTRINQSALRKLGESIGLASHASPLKIQWNQFASGSIASRSIGLDLSQIPRGRYLLRIEAGTASSTREVTID
jgi:hypothetical protein